MRVLSGIFKGRKLLPPPASSITRPVTAQAKKSIFSILMPILDGSRVLDLYCGTGTMGIEALSHGAIQCCFVEKDRLVASRLRRNIETIGACDKSIIKTCSVERQLRVPFAGLGDRADIAFVDPPYAIARKWDHARVTRTLFTPLVQQLAPEAVVILRLPAKVDLPENLGLFKIQREKHFGDMNILFLQINDQ